MRWLLASRNCRRTENLPLMTRTRLFGRLTDDRTRMLLAGREVSLLGTRSVDCIILTIRYGSKT